MKRNKQFVLLEAYSYDRDCVIARLVLHIIDEGATHFYGVERYFDYEDKFLILDPEYYNPYQEIVRRDYATAFQALQLMVKDYEENFDNIEEIEIR